MITSRNYPASSFRHPLGRTSSFRQWRKGFVFYGQIHFGLRLLNICSKDHLPRASWRRLGLHPLIVYISLSYHPAAIATMAPIQLLDELWGVVISHLRRPLPTPNGKNEWRSVSQPDLIRCMRVNRVSPLQTKLEGRSSRVSITEVLLKPRFGITAQLSTYTKSSSRTVQPSRPARRRYSGRDGRRCSSCTRHQIQSPAIRL